MEIGIMEKIDRRISELEGVVKGSQLDWEQIIYLDEEYDIRLFRDFYDERGFYIRVWINDYDEVEIEELPEHVLEKVLESLEDFNLEEAIKETVRNCTIVVSDWW